MFGEGFLPLNEANGLQFDVGVGFCHFECMTRTLRPHRISAGTHNAKAQCVQKEEATELTLLVMDRPVSQFVAESAVRREYQCCLGYADHHILTGANADSRRLAHSGFL